MTDEMTNWTQAPEKLKQQSFKFYGKTAGKLAKKTKDKLGRIDWGAVSDETAAWWKEKGYQFP